MNSDKPSPTNRISLEQLLRRGDIWRGQSQRFLTQTVLPSGYEILDAALLNKGWPLASLVEICQPNLCGHSEWLLAAPALLQLKVGYMVLLNPPAMPFAQGLLQLGIDLDRLIIVQTENKADFLASFVELARAEVCVALLAWQPKQNLSYTELRKCLLATADGKGLSLLFRPAATRQQSSPASVRIEAQLTVDSLQLNIFKQKGWLNKGPSQIVQLPLPIVWQPLFSHQYLDKQDAQPQLDKKQKQQKPKLKGVAAAPKLSGHKP